MENRSFKDLEDSFRESKSGPSSLMMKTGLTPSFEEGKRSGSDPTPVVPCLILR
jgi:hypothetical protein